MFSSFKIPIKGLLLLVGAVNLAFAAQAPVDDLSSPVVTVNSTNSTDTTPSVTPVPPMTLEQLSRALQSRNNLQIQMQQQLDDLSADLQQLRGQIEKTTYEMNQVLTRQRELFIELDKLRTQMSTSETNQPASAQGIDHQAQQGTFSENRNVQTAYQNAVDLILKKRDYLGAIQAFEKFRKDFPDSTFSANVHYWLGQLYFANKEDKKAVENFKGVLNFKDSNKRADALVKLGSIEKRRGDLAQAKQYYQQVIQEYPDTSSASFAQQQLSQLK